MRPLGVDPRGPSYVIVRRLFLRSLAVVYLIAFVSLWVQVAGLIGAGGILPVADFLDRVRAATGPERYWLLPTLCWLNESDAFLHWLCGGGAVLSLLLLLEIAPVPVLALLWVFYLSLTTAGQVFLGYQWDNLLLETGLLAVFFAPLSVRPRDAAASPPSRLSLALLRFLLLRLTFGSGLVKLSSGDPAWRSLTALRYHYETQPLPTWMGWWAHQGPAAFQTFSTLVMFGVELVAPLLIFAPRRFRLAALVPLVGLQVLIAVTGNYGFFNLLSLVLCLLLLDDAALPARRRRDAGGSAETRVRRWPRWILVPVAVTTGSLASVELIARFGVRLPWPAPVAVFAEAMAPFRSVNAYGLFAVMTTSRPEIVVEGSADGATWRQYPFRWKAGDLHSAPGFVAPHQPRLDWQMWFAALGSCEDNPWFVRFLSRLLEGSPPVLSLLRQNPFPEGPPRYIRTVLYDYRFTDPAQRRRDGAWWRRERRGLYCPVLERTLGEVGRADE